MPPRRLRYSPAFTLIELTVIIALMAVLASVLTPAYSRSYQHSRFMGTVNDIADLLADARDRAIANDAEVRVTFSGDPAATFTCWVKRMRSAWCGASS